MFCTRVSCGYVWLLSGKVLSRLCASSWSLCVNVITVNSLHFDLDAPLTVLYVRILKACVTLQNR